MKEELYINSKFILDADLTPEAFCVLVTMNGVTHKASSNYCLSYNSIAYYMFGRLCTTREKESVIEGVKKLISLGYISIVEIFSSYEAVYDLSYIKEQKDGDFYVMISRDDLHKAMNIKTQKSKYRIFKFFTCLVNTFNKSSTMNAKYRGKIGFMSQDYLCNVGRLNIDTLRDYIKILEDNKLIYVIRHSGDFKKSTDLNGFSRVTGISNTYSRYADKKLCEEYAGAVNSNKNQMSRRAATDLSRSMKQKYNAMLKGKEYPEDVVLTIYEYIKESNQKKEDDSSPLLDMSVFEKYGLS